MTPAANIEQRSKHSGVSLQGFHHYLASLRDHRCGRNDRTKPESLYLHPPSLCFLITYAVELDRCGHTLNAPLQHNRATGVNSVVLKNSSSYIRTVFIANNYFFLNAF